MERKLWVGIDPGKNGCIVFIWSDNNEIGKHKIPLVKREYDINKLCDLLDEISLLEHYKVSVVLEDVHAIFGSAAGSTFEFGRGLGILEGIIAAKNLSFVKVQPKKWQKYCFEGIPEIRKPASVKQKAAGRQGSVDTKAMALLAVKRLFPNEQLTFGKAEKPHDGLIDALLMAYYCKNHF